MSQIIALALLACIIAMIGGGTGALLIYWLIKIRPVKPVKPVIVHRTRRTQHRTSRPAIITHRDSNETEIRPKMTATKIPMPPPEATKPIGSPPNPYGFHPSPTLRWKP